MKNTRDCADSFTQIYAGGRRERREKEESHEKGDSYYKVRSNNGMNDGEVVIKGGGKKRSLGFNKMVSVRGDI
jgi:hypothetical protein